MKNTSANAGDLRDAVHSPGREDPLEEGMATRSSILAWRIPGTEEPGSLSAAHGVTKESDMTERLSNHCCQPNSEQASWGWDWSVFPESNFEIYFKGLVFPTHFNPVTTLLGL